MTCTRKQDLGYISLGRVPKNGTLGTYSARGALSN